MKRRILTLNDVHLGVQRSSGTTPATAIALRESLHDQHEQLINCPEYADCDLLYNGDLFDAFSVPLGDGLRVLVSWTNWMYSHPDGKIHVGRGNHDISKDSSKVSMFDFVCEVMTSTFPDRFFFYTEFAKVEDGIYIMPHYINQEEFDVAMTAAAAVLPDDVILLLHANYDNEFAEQADHSLNVSKDMVRKFRSKRTKMVFGHEHDFSEDKFMLVLIPGNQFPTSIADMLGNKGKFCTVLTPGDLPEIELVQLSKVSDLYIEVDWQAGVKQAELSAQPSFVKVTGTATAEDSVKVIDFVASMRARYPNAFVVANGVHVAEQEELANMVVTGDEIRAVNVMDFLFEQMTPEQAVVIKKVLGEING